VEIDNAEDTTTNLFINNTEEQLRVANRLKKNIN